MLFLLGSRCDDPGVRGEQEIHDMAIASAELVLFAIRAGVRLGQAARTAYIEQVRMREIALPFPNAGNDPSITDARSFFKTEDEGAGFLADDSKLDALHTKALANKIPNERGNPDRDAYINLYLVYRSIAEARLNKQALKLSNGAEADPDAFLAMFRFEQWDEEDPNRPKPVRRVLGAIVDVGVEYFASVPGALGSQTTDRRVLTTFVQAIDRIDFEQVALDADPFGELAGQLLIAALETVGSQPDIVAGDPNVQELIRITTSSLSADIATKLAAAGTTDEQDSIRSWGELVFRSVLQSGARHALQHPGTFLGIDNTAQSDLVSRVGIAAIDLVTASDDFQPEALFSAGGLQTLVSTSLAVLADHPELVTDTDNEGVTALIRTIATDLSDIKRVVELGLIPEVARIVLNRTGQHLELIWPDLKPENHLLLTAGRVTLEVLTKKPTASAKWKPQFGRTELITVVDAVVDELASNPDWLLKLAADADANLRAALEASLTVLRKRADERLSPTVAAEVFAAAARAIALRQGFLDTLPNGKPAVAHALDAIFAEIFKAPAGTEASWRLFHREVLNGIVEASLDALAESDLDVAAIKTVSDIIADRVQGLVNGDTIDVGALEVVLLAAFSEVPQ